MKVFFSPIQQPRVYKYNSSIITKNNGQTNSAVNKTQLPLLYSTNFPNISFGMNSDAKFLLNQTDRLLCAYSGKEMISPQLAKKITDKLAKTPNLQSAVNYLFQYQDKYMHDIESQVFDIFNDREIRKYYGNKTFQDVLNYYKPEALARLKIKQFKVLTSTDGLIEHLSQPVKEMVIMIKNDSISKMNNDTFGRKAPLEMLKRIKAKGKDNNIINQIYDEWYTLPSSSTDIDAFIVSCSKMTHEQIAKRLVSSAFATIEHIKPKSKNGSDNLSNYLLVSAEYNNARSSLPLNTYIALRKDLDIENNLQIYIDLVKDDIKHKNPSFIQHIEYPLEVTATLKEETKGKIQINIDGISFPKEVTEYKERTSKKLSKKYRVHQ